MRKTAKTILADKAELSDVTEIKGQLPMLAELHRRAEAKVRERRSLRRPSVVASISKAEALRLNQELEIHQVELEMQNLELQRARNEVEAGLQRYSDLYDFAPLGYFTLSQKGVIQMVNLAGSRLVGVERSKLVGKPFVCLAPAPARAALNAFLLKVWAGEGAEPCGFRFSTGGNEARFVNMEAEITADAQECRVVLTDVTERVREEEKVSVSEIRYRRLFEAAHDGVVLLDPDMGKITDANPFMTKLLGYSRKELLGKQLYEIGLLKDEVASREMFRRLKRNHQVRYENLPLKSVSGRHQQVEVVANLYRENDHMVIQCNIRDITERKKAENVLRSNEALFSALLNQTPVGVYVVDSGLKMRHANPSALPVFAKIRPLIGRDFTEILRILWPRRIAERLLGLFQHTLKTGETYQSPEFAERRRDMRRKEFYEWQIQRITLPTGEHAVVCFFNNITERKMAEDTRRRMEVVTATNHTLGLEISRRELVERALRKSQSGLRRMSHQILLAQEEERRQISRELHDEIGQTLLGMSIHLSALALEASGDHTRGLRGKIAHTQRILKKSVEIVHQFALELRPVVLDDLGLIPALKTFINGISARTGIKIRFKTSPWAEQLDVPSRTILFRVAQEALTNVARHAKATLVGVSIAKTPGFIQMRVKDDGKSFDAEGLFRESGDHRLGLLGMRERLEMAGGKFAIESSPRHGTLVIASIPFPGANTRGKSSAKSRDKR